MTIIIDADDETGETNKMFITETENFNFVTLTVNSVEHTVSITDLYRATLPFMDYRAENLRERE